MKIFPAADNITGKSVAHLFTSENHYNFAYLEFLERNFDISSCIFIFRGKTRDTFSYSVKMKERIIFAGDTLRYLSGAIPVMKKCDRIIIHQLPYGPSLFIWYFLTGLLSRTTWIIWGGDVYLYRQSRESLKKSIYEFLRRKIIARIPRVASFIPGDFEIVKQIYNSKAQYLRSMYPLPVDFLKFNINDTFRPSGQDKIILVGNSGNESNLHAEILLKLEFLKHSGVRIICPLSYSGNAAYINSVIKTGNEIFGEKFEPVTTILEPSKYLKLLASIDIAVMNHKRQQGLGNILPLLYFGKKVYLRNDTTSSVYLQSIGCRFYDVESIVSDPGSFLSTDGSAMASNREIISGLLSEENCVHLWTSILNIPVLQ